MKYEKSLQLFKILVLAVAMTGLLGSVGPQGPVRGSTPMTIAIMTTADLQSAVAPYIVVQEGKQLKVGGLARISALAKKIRSEVDGALLLSSGDDLIPPLFSIFHGTPEMKGMTLAGYDIVTPGNHEFDIGAEAYKDALKSANFEVVSANLVIDDQELRDRILPYTIKRLGDIKIGVFGMMTPDFLRVCSPGDSTTVDQDIISLAQKAVDNLVKEQCDLIIGLTHIGVELDRQLAKGVTGIDIIIGGHDHQYIYETSNNTIIVQAGSRGEYLGVLRFTFSNGEIVNPTWEKILLDSTIGYDSKVQDLITGYMAEYKDRLGQVIGRSSVNLDARKGTVRQQESNLGNLVADSWLAWFSGSDIALVTGGSIRGDKIYPAGPISHLTTNEILPFRDEIVSIEIKGSELKQLLEISASAIRMPDDQCPDSNRAGSGGFLQVAGLRITIDLSKPAFCAVYSGRGISQLTHSGSRIVKTEVYRNGLWTPLNLSAIYRVLVNAWTSSGGDGYYVLLAKDISKQNTTMFTTDILASYIQRHSPVSPKIEGRINITGK